MMGPRFRPLPSLHFGAYRSPDGEIEWSAEAELDDWEAREEAEREDREAEEES